MSATHRRRGPAPIALAAFVIGAAASGETAPDRSAGARCRADALENWYCAADPQGAAVVDELGRVVCAPGECIKQDTQDGETWMCSSVSGGRAAAAPEGPVCDGGCREPQATACKKI